MLLRNGLSTNVIPLSLSGAGWQNFVHDTAVMNQSNSSGFTALSAYSTGLYFPHCMIPPRTAGRIVAHDTVTGTGTISTADMWLVKLAQASIGGDGTLTATGGLIVQLVAALAGSGTISSADMKAFLQLVASIGGSGSASATATGLGAMLAALAGSGTLAGSTATGVGALSADITVTGTGLSTANVGPAVWASIAADNNTPGTMGEKLNAAGTAGDPWTTALPGSYVDGTAGHIIGEIIQKILRNRSITDPVAGTLTVYDDDNVTPLLVAPIYQDAAGTIPYQGQGAERKDRLV